MSDDKTPIEQAVDQAMDAFVYAPIGLVFDGPALFPKLVEKGRTQVKVARMMGQMAVQMGQTEAEKRMARTQGPLRDALAAFGVVTPDAPATAKVPPTDVGAAKAPSAAETGTTTTATGTAKKPAAPKPAAKKARPAKKPATRTRTAAKKAAATKSAATTKSAAAGSTAAGSLAIPDYDSLSASQVVKRLQGLDPSDLDAVKAYESQTRGRKTILNRITQLQKD